MKKLLMTLLASMMLLSATGCSNTTVTDPTEKPDTSVGDSTDNPAIKDGKLVPVLSEAELQGVLTPELTELFTTIYGNPAYGLEQVTKLGLQVPNIKLPLINEGETVSLGDLKGSPYVLEIAASWCGFCQEASKTSIPALYEKYDDFKLVQIFTDENIPEIEKFYENAGKTYADIDYVAPLSEEAYGIVTALDVQAFPTFAFINPDGKVAYIHTGLINEEIYEIIRPYHLGEKNLTDLLNPEFDLDRATIKVQDVANAVADEVFEKVQEITKDTDTDDGYAWFANLGRSVKDFTILDITGETVDSKDLEGQLYSLSFIFGNEDHTKAVEDFAMMAQDSEIPSYLVVIEDTSYDEAGNPTVINPTEWLSGLPVNLSGLNVIPFGQKNVTDAFFSIDMYDVPTHVYVGTESKIEAVVSGEMTNEKHKSIIDFINSGDHIYNRLMK